MADCAQELCPNWSGDGRVCPCALLDLEPPSAAVWIDEDDEDDPHMQRWCSCPFDCPDCPGCDCCNCQTDHSEEDGRDG